MDTNKKFYFIGIAEIVFALLSSLIFTIGRCVFKTGSVYTLTSSIQEHAIVFFIMFVPFLLVFAFFGKGIRAFSRTGSTYSAKMINIFQFVAVLPVIVSCITGVLLFYPGLTVDRLEYLVAFNSIPVEKYPVIHTLIRQAFIYFDMLGLPYPYGVIIYFGAHILVLSVACGYTVRREMSEGISMPVVLITMVYFAVFSVFMIQYRIESADILFFSSVLIVFLLLTRSDRKEKGGVIAFWLFFVLSCLFRYNFLPAAVILFFVLLFMIGNRTSRKYLAVLIVGIISVLAIFFALYRYYDIEDLRETDILGVPTAQIASVYENHNSELTIAEKFLTDGYMDPGAFTARDARFVKNSFNEELYLSDRSAFWDLYMHFAEKYPYEFLDEFLNLNVIIWHPGVMGLPLCIILAGLYNAFRAKRRGYTAGVLMMLALWITYLFEARSDFIHIYPFLLTAPAFLLPVFAHKAASAEKEEESEEDKEESGEESEEEKSEEKKTTDKKSEDGKSADKAGKTEDIKSSDKEKKPEDKKSEEKKAEDRKTEERKSEDQKAEDNKSEAKKTEEERADNNKKPEEDKEGIDK